MTSKLDKIEEALKRAKGCFKECGIGFHSIDEAITIISELRDNVGIEKLREALDPDTSDILYARKYGELPADTAYKAAQTLL